MNQDNARQAGLNPCPFCGCQGIAMMSSRDGNPLRHTIKCEDCPGMADFHSSTAAQAVDAWNRRAPIAAQSTDASNAATGLLVAFDSAYAKAAESSQPDDWMQAALYARQWRNEVLAAQSADASNVAPVEPTPAMYEAAQRIRFPIGGEGDMAPLNATEIRRLWIAMIGAMPASNAATGQVVVIPDAWKDLMSFYDAKTPEEMVAEMEKHILKLQVTVLERGGYGKQQAFTKVREG